MSEFDVGVTFENDVRQQYTLEAVDGLHAWQQVLDKLKNMSVKAIAVSIKKVEVKKDES